MNQNGVDLMNKNKSETEDNFHSELLMLFMTNYYILLKKYLKHLFSWGWVSVMIVVDLTGKTA